MTTHQDNEMHQYPLCSVRSRENGDEPIGSAGSHGRYLFVEVPLPWTDDVQDSPYFPEGLRAKLKECADKGSPFRFQAFRSDDDHSPNGSIRVFSFTRSGSTSSYYDKQEYIIPIQNLNELVDAILIDSHRLSQWDAYLQPSSETREVFICTHGTHDICCGKFGYPVYEQFNKKYANDQTIRAWRTSHIGGHRYAPTLIDFPEGRYWARITPEILDQLVNRSGTFAELANHYRGWGMLNVFEQVAERELFVQFGWDWTLYEKQSTCKMMDDTSAIVRLNYTSPDRTVTGTYEIEVYVARTLMSGGCGNDSVQSIQYRLRPLQPSHLMHTE